MATCKDCLHWNACKAMLEADGGIRIADDFKGSADRCKNFVSAADVAPRAEWISVEERLPDQELRELTSKDPLMTFRCMTARKSDYHDGLIYVYQAFYDERGFINENGVNITESVTHWSHLPEPPDLIEGEV